MAIHLAVLISNIRQGCCSSHQSLNVLEHMSRQIGSRLLRVHVVPCQNLKATSIRVHGQSYFIHLITQEQAEGPIEIELGQD